MRGCKEVWSVYGVLRFAKPGLFMFEVRVLELGYVWRRSVFCGVRLATG